MNPLSFRGELNRVCARILRREPFVHYRFGDGELLLIDGLEIGPNTQAAKTDLWQAPARLTRLGEDLRTVLEEQGPWAEFGIPCPCCNDAGYRRLLRTIQRSPVVPANLFINANYRPFLRWLATLQGAAVVSNERASVQEMPFCVTGRMTVPDDGVVYYETHREELLCKARRFAESLPPRSIVFVSAGPLAEVLLFFMWNHCPEHVYVDVGSALDEFSYGRKTRLFMYEDNEYSKKKCALPVMTFEEVPAAEVPAAPPVAAPVVAAQTLSRETPAPKGICLCMIVKNEAHVIQRCLDSVMGFIDTWVIVDTGSTDDTQRIIRETMRDVPGELHERPWVDFAHNRNEAINLCVGVRSHVLVIDADDVFEMTKKKPPLSLHCYQVRVFHGELEHCRPHVFRPEMEFGHRYAGVVHEYLQGVIFSTVIDGAAIRIVGGGARSKSPDKYLRDAALLVASFEKDGDPRSAFYAAQSYRDAGDFVKAFQWYEKRAALSGGFADEVFISLWESAKIIEKFEKLGSTPDAIVLAYLRAWEKQPHRAEPLWSLSMYLRDKGRFALAASFADTACRITKPTTGLFINAEVYDWKCLRELNITCDYVPGRRARSIEAGDRILRSNAPEDVKVQTRRNIGYTKDKMKKGDV